MNLLSRLALVTVLVCAGFGAACWIVFNQDRSEATKLLQEVAAERAARIESATQLQGTGLEALVSSYAWWDDMVRFMDKPDEEWASTNLDNIVGIPTGGDAIWVLDAGLAPVHTIDKDYQHPPLPFPSAEVLRRGIGDRFTFRYFTFIDGKLWEIFGAAIQSASFWRHQTPVRGYLLLGRRWDEAWLSQLNTLVGAQITWQPLTAAPRSGSATDHQQTLKGLDGEPLVQLSARFNFELVDTLQQASARRSLYISLGAVLAIAILAGVVAFLVLRPLSRITRSLESRVPTHLTELLNSRTEFGEIARLVAGQLRWGRMLEEEMRRQLERPSPASTGREAESNEALRLRLSSNLHDGPIQSIYAAGLQLAMVQTALESGQGLPPVQLSSVNAMLQQALSDLRNLILDLEPEELHESDLETALGRLEERVRQLARCPFDLTVPDGALDALSREAQIHLYFVCRELASNTLRHARPTRAALRFHSAHGFLRVEWTNDGVRPPSGPRGSGLANLERRVTALDGRVTYGPVPPDSWRVEVELPYTSLIPPPIRLA